MPPCPLCPPVFWAWSFVRLDGVFSSCGPLELWESLASPVRRPRSPSASGVYAPLSLLSPPRVLGVEFCSSLWCVQLLWPPGAVGVSGVPCWPPAFAVLVRCVCPLVPVVAAPVFWAWSFVPLGGVLSSCGRLELWESLASPVRRPRSPSASGVYAPLSPLSAVFWAWSFVRLDGVFSSCGPLELWESLASPVRRPRSPSASGVYAPLSPLSPVFLAWSFVRLDGVFSSCGPLELWESLASPVRRPRSPSASGVYAPCPCCPPRVLGVEFCSSSWCVQLLWPPEAVGVSGVPCWRPAFAVRVRFVCPLIPVVPSPVFWAWSFVPLGSVLSSCGRLELWESGLP